MVGEEEGSVLLVAGWPFGLEEVGRSFDQSWSGWEEARREEERIAGLHLEEEDNSSTYSTKLEAHSYQINDS